MSDLSNQHPDWALAYILQDWRRKRAVAKAYKAVCDADPDALALLKEAHRKCEVYAAALREVVEAQ
jgi:hypothetical protein